MISRRIHQCLLLVAFGLMVLRPKCGCLCEAATASSSSAGDPDSFAVRRERHLDHLDVQTLCHYLGVDPSTFEPLDEEAVVDVGHDTAVLFYAQWDTNSHTLAPYWDNMAMILNAGSKKSKLIMGLFNCERDLRYTEACAALNVQVYPTMMFIGHGPFHDEPLPLPGSKKKKGHVPYKNAVQFNGNWQYTDSVLDWIRAMKRLSSYNQFNIFQQFRNMILGNQNDKQALPVGLPKTQDVGALAALSNLDNRVEELKNETIQLEKMATHASLLLESILLPPMPNNDTFTFLIETRGWDKENQDPIALVTRNCVAELSLDYCTRLSSRITTDFLDEAMLEGSSAEYPSFFEIEVALKERVQEREPFCAIFDECLANDFVKATCRPEQCPFQSSVACTYVNACFDTTIQEEYAVALDIIAEGETFPPPKPMDAQASKAGGAFGVGKPESDDDATKANKKKASGWGF